MADLSSELVSGLKSKLRGQVLQPGEAGYEAARKVWNAMIDRRPALIVKSAGAADVMDTVAFARDNGVLLSVRAGGHNIGGLALCEGAVTLDLSDMKSVRIDPSALRAYVEPSVAPGSP